LNSPKLTILRKPNDFIKNHISSFALKLIGSKIDEIETKLVDNCFRAIRTLRISKHAAEPASNDSKSNTLERDTIRDEMGKNQYLEEWRERSDGGAAHRQSPASSDRQQAPTSVVWSLGKAGVEIEEVGERRDRDLE